ncbi:MAG: TolC family protein [Treponema sp.]|uniref:TolC family protein n=1 Tax=Treponema sp. TaxID=166 RepID=UPI0025D2A31B|nr:TolC family protein [Treponema sp.]MBQ8681025.1 TolC family protein [Treponema sp.]
MLRRVFYILLLFFFCAFAFSESELETLWAKCAENSRSLKIQQIQKEQAEVNEEFADFVYLPTFTLAAESSFSEKYDEIKKYPYNADGTLTTTFPIPGGGYISTEIEYEMNRYIMNSSASLSPDSVGYDQIPEVTVAYVQSLNPFFLHGNKNPVKRNLENKTKIENISYESAVLSVKMQVASKYIQLRRYARLIANIENELSFLNYTIDSLETNKSRGIVTAAEIWSYQNKIVEYNESLLSYIQQRENLIKELEVLCGDFETFDLNAKLPQTLSCTPEYDFTLRQFALQRENLKMQKILEGQSYAPKLGFQGSASYNIEAAQKDSLTDQWKDKNGSLLWTVGLSFEFSPENMARLKRDKILYEKNQKILSEQEELYIKNKRNSIEMYGKIISYYEMLLSQSKESKENKKKYYESMQIQFERGINTELDLMQSKLTLDSAETIVKNYEDIIWYYTWLKSLIVE